MAEVHGNRTHPVKKITQYYYYVMEMEKVKVKVTLKTLNFSKL
jgi:hypothetical protein